MIIPFQCFSQLAGFIGKGRLFSLNKFTSIKVVFFYFFQREIKLIHQGFLRTILLIFTRAANNSEGEVIVFWVCHF